MKTNKPFVLAIHMDSRNSFGGYNEDKILRKDYATKQGLMQGAHYWARYNQADKDDLWRGGYYSNYVLTLHGDSSRLVLHAFEVRGDKDGTTVAIDLSSIANRSGLGEDIRGDAYKQASSKKAGA